jgi:predicted phosphodiesterase
MRFAVISDTHFGDPASQLAAWNGAAGRAELGSKYEEFKQAAGINDYLILLGDIFDLSISSYEQAYGVAKIFFKQIQADKIARYMIYVPGNHDGDMWHFYEHQVNITMRITGGRPPRNFRFSVPAIINGCKGTPAENVFTLHGVSTNPEYPDFGYGGIFLDSITRDLVNDKITGTLLPFAFAYPNIYLVTDQESVLLTHGHYLEGYWSLLGEWVMKIAGEDLAIGDALDLWEMVAINFPLNQLACTGVGQAGPLTSVIRDVQRQYKDGDLKRIKNYLDRLDNAIDELTPSRGLLDAREALTDAASNYIKKKIVENLESSTPTRYDEKFIHRKDTLDLFRGYFDCSLLEIDSIQSAGGPEIGTPRYVIFGHTHEPIPWGDPGAPKTMSRAGRPVTLYNTGGWLNKLDKQSGQTHFCGAEVIVFDNSCPQPWTSHAIR